MTDDFDVEAMLEAPYRKEVSLKRNSSMAVMCLVQQSVKHEVFITSKARQGQVTVKCSLVTL